jgi:hypothetical protein
VQVIVHRAEPAIDASWYRCSQIHAIFLVRIFLFLGSYIKTKNKNRTKNMAWIVELTITEREFKGGI